MADKKSQKVIKVVLPKGQQTLFSEPDLKSIETAVKQIGVAYTNISDKQDKFFSATKNQANGAVNSLNAVADAATKAKNAIAAMPKTPSTPYGTGGRTQKTVAPTVNPVAAAMASSGQSSAVEPVAQGMSAAGKVIAEAEKKKSDAAKKFADDWIKSAEADRKKQEADSKKAADASAKAQAAKAAADKKFADDWVREQQENAKKQAKDKKSAQKAAQAANSTATASQGGYGPFLNAAQRAKVNAQNAADNPGNPVQPAPRFGDRQDAYDDAVQKIRKGKGLYEVSQDLTSTHVEAAFDEAKTLVRKDLKGAAKRESQAQRDIEAAKSSGDKAALEAAREQLSIAEEDKRTLRLRKDQNKQFAKKVRVSDKKYEDALEARNKALAAVDSASNPILKKKAEFDLQTKQKSLDQAHRERQAIRNPNAASKGFGGQNLTFAAQQAAYGVEDFFQVLAAGQSPVRAFLGAANNIGPALALAGIGGTAASVGIAGLLAVTTLYDVAARKSKKSTEDWKDSIDRLADSMGKIEKIKGRSTGGSISEDILKISGDPIAVSAEINKLKAQMNRMEKESIPDTRGDNRGVLPAIGNQVGGAFGATFGSIPALFGDLMAFRGFENDRYEPKGRFNGPKNFSQAAKEDPNLWNMGLNERVGARQFVNELQAKFDKEKEAGVYKELEGLLKELDDRIKSRSELVRQAVEGPNTIEDELMRAKSLQSKSGRPAFGEAVSRASERLQGNEIAIREAREQVNLRGPELKKKMDDAIAAQQRLNSASEKEAKIKEFMATYSISRQAAEFAASRVLEQENQKLAAEVEIRRKAYEDLNGKPEALQIVADSERAKFKRALGIAGAGLRNFSQILPGVVNESLFRLDDIKQSRGALKESFDASSAGDQQTILKQLDNAARPKGTAQVMGVEGLYNTIQTSLLNNDPSLEVEKQIRDEIKALRDDLARGAKVPGRAMGGMIRGYAEGGFVGGESGTDKNIAALSRGEFVVKPGPAKENASVLQAINSGTLTTSQLERMSNEEKVAYAQRQQQARKQAQSLMFSEGNLDVSAIGSRQRAAESRRLEPMTNEQKSAEAAKFPMRGRLPVEQELPRVMRPMRQFGRSGSGDDLPVVQSPKVVSKSQAKAQQLWRMEAGLEPKVSVQPRFNPLFENSRRLRSLEGKTNEEKTLEALGIQERKTQDETVRQTQWNSRVRGFEQPPKPTEKQKGLDNERYLRALESIQPRGRDQFALDAERFERVRGMAFHEMPRTESQSRWRSLSAMENGVIPKTPSSNKTKSQYQEMYDNGLIKEGSLEAKRLMEAGLLEKRPPKKAKGFAHGGYSDARDTIPARLRPGEVVLTPQQQERLGQNAGKRSAEMFGEAGVPGFAGGGGLGYGIRRRNDYIKAMRKRQQEAVAKKNADRERESRRNFFMGPLPTLGQLRAGENSQNHYATGERLGDQWRNLSLSQRAQDSMKRASGVGSDESTLRFLRKKMLEPRTGGESSEMEFTMPGPRSQGTKGIGANAYSGKSTATHTFPLGPNFREMAKDEHVGQMQRRGMSQKAQDTTSRLYSEPKSPSLVKSESDAKRAAMLARKNAVDAAAPKEEEKPEAWSFGSLKSGILPKQGYGGRGSTVRGKTRTNSWMDKATPEFSREASTLMNHQTGRYTKGTTQREKQVAGLLSDIPTPAKPNYSAGENTEYRGWKAGQDEVKGMPKIEYGKDALKAQEDRMNRLGIGGADVSSKGMEVSLKDGLDNSKVLTDILRTLNEKLGMISSGVGQTVGAIQNMETGGLI